MKTATFGATGFALSSQVKERKPPAPQNKPKYPIRVTAMAGVLRGKTQVEGIELAYKAGLDGLQLQFVPDLKNPDSLRHKSVELSVREASHQYGVQISSLCIGALGSTPLKSDPEGVTWVMDAIKCARNLGSRVILLPILGKGTLQSEEEFIRLFAVLKELGPYAGDEGIILGIESYNSGEDQLRIVTEVNHPAVKIYHDAGNEIRRDFDSLKIIPLLGDYICEVHVKNGPNLLRVKEIMKKPTPKGRTEGLDHPALASAYKKIGYKGWFSLETSVVSGDPIADAIDNIAYVREVYNIFD